MKPIVIGICGGSCSGKTTVCNAIESIYPDDVAVIKQDSYYKGGDESTDFDHPASLEFDFMVKQLRRYISGYSIHAPIYDFTIHSRREDEFLFLEQKKIVLLDGILIFNVPELLELCDLRIYVDADLDTRYRRRRNRDIKERGRDLDGVDLQWTRDVKPNHMRFVEPSKRHAHIIINNDTESSDAERKRMVQIKLISAYIKECIAQ